MVKENFKLRFAAIKDANKLLNIYAPYVKNTDTALSDVSFEYTVPGAVEFSERIRDISARFPYIILEVDEKIVGYAYAHAYKERAAYQWSVETTIYLALAERGKGYGRILYNTLEKILKLMGVTNLYACIAGDNEASIKMHEAMGYKVNGTFKQCAFKNGHWLDMVWMEKMLEEHRAAPDFVKSIHDLDEAELKIILEEI